METTATDTAEILSTNGAHVNTAAAMSTMIDLAPHSLYLMGASFVLGSLFTLFLLLVLDFVRRGKGDRDY